MWKIHSNMFFRIYTSLNQLMCLCKNFERIKEFFGHVNDFSWRDETYFPKKIQTKKWHQTPRHYLRSKKIKSRQYFPFRLIFHISSYDIRRGKKRKGKALMHH